MHGYKWPINCTRTRNQYHARNANTESTYRGITWKCAWNTSWPAAASLFCSTVTPSAPVAFWTNLTRRGRSRSDCAACSALLNEQQVKMARTCVTVADCSIRYTSGLWYVRRQRAGRSSFEPKIVSPHIKGVADAGLWQQQAVPRHARKGIEDG